MPFAIDELPAVIVIDCNTAAVTPRATLSEVIPLWAAVMLLEPTAAPVASPVALILTTAGFELVHVALFVMSNVLPSLKVPVAVNCTLVPLAIEELLALTVIVCNVAAVTANGKLFDITPFCVAVMVLEPTAAPVAKPFALMLTVAVLELAQVVVLVKSCVLPSVKVPVAVN